MLGISADQILEHLEGAGNTPESDRDRGVTLSHTDTDPTVDSDGIDRLTVVEEAADRYLVEYRGFRAGHLSITREGVAELGESLLGDPDEIPSWVLQTPTDAETLPWWVPEDYDGQRVVSCQRCGRETRAREILTPDSIDGAVTDRFCPECWDEVRDRWHPEHGIDGEPAEQTMALRDSAATDPERVDLEAVAERIDADDPDVQRQALHALREMIEARPSEALDMVSTLRERLESDDVLVRCAALSCLAELAELFPREVTPAAEDVIALLGTDADERIVDCAVTYLAAVAKADSGAVVDAVPKFAALLQTDVRREQDVLVTLTHVATEYPDQVAPITTELQAYVDHAETDETIAALATLGNVAKEYPNVADSLGTTLVELLDAERYRLRANAAGLLAELALEYPDEVRPAVPKAIELLDDDEKTRYNATSILARMADTRPEAVEPAIDPLVDAHDEDLARSRENACWALGYLEVEAARAELEATERSDPDDDVRETAEWALLQLESSPE